MRPQTVRLLFLRKRGKVLEKSGGCARTRTVDPLIKSQLLYHLSYAPWSGRGCSRGDPACPAPLPDFLEIAKLLGYRPADDE